MEAMCIQYFKEWNILSVNLCFISVYQEKHPYAVCERWRRCPCSSTSQGGLTSITSWCEAGFAPVQFQPTEEIKFLFLSTSSTHMRQMINFCFVVRCKTCRWKEERTFVSQCLIGVILASCHFSSHIFI